MLIISVVEGARIDLHWAFFLAGIVDDFRSHWDVIDFFFLAFVFVFFGGGLVWALRLDLLLAAKGHL